MKVTVFKQLNLTNTPFFRDIDVIIDNIKKPTYLNLINSIRLEEDKNKRNELKKQLPCICWSGLFRSRSAKGLIEHSGLICLDFDNVIDIEELKSKLSKDKHAYVLFISPSGNGLKLIVKIPKCESDAEHKAYFNSLVNHFKSDYLDKSGSDVSRICYFSHDENILVNTNAEVFTDKIEGPKKIYTETPILKLKSSNEIINKLEIWWNKKFGFIQGERNTNIYKLAIALNDYGIPKHEAQSYLNKYVMADFSQEELDKIVKSAYSNIDTFGTLFFNDDNTLTEIKKKIHNGADKKKIITDFKQRFAPEEIEEAIVNINDNVSISEFWQFTPKGVCTIKHHSFKVFLEQQGYFKFYTTDSDNFIFVKVENNIINRTTADKIKAFVLDYLESNNHMRAYELIASSSKIFKDDYLNLLSQAKVSFYEDDLTKGVIYYQNGALIIHKDKLELIDYFNLDGFVWEQQIIKRNFVKVDFQDCVFQRFIYYVSGQNIDKFNSIRSVIGYMLHSFKTSANNKAIIINDETISDNPNGGSGKGIFWNALKRMKNLVDIDGKQFDFTKSFLYQLVNPDTQILVFDDVKRNFAFENLFSLITEGITIEKKNKDAIKIPVNKSPKILITTNYTVGGVGGSFERRKFEIEFSSYFNASHTPEKEFKHMLFEEWDEIEWKKFDSFMVDCLQYYLTNGLVKHDFTNLELRKLINSTNSDFYEWIVEQKLQPFLRYDKSELYNNIKTIYPDFGKWLKQNTLTKWLEIYGKYLGYEVLQGQSNGVRWIEYRTENKTTNFFNENTEDIF